MFRNTCAARPHIKTHLEVDSPVVTERQISEYLVLSSSTHWLTWSPSISRMTPFSCSLAAVYFRDCGFHFLLPLSSPLLSTLIDLREFLNTQNTHMMPLQNKVKLSPTP